MTYILPGVGTSRTSWMPGCSSATLSNTQSMSSGSRRRVATPAIHRFFVLCSPWPSVSSGLLWSDIWYAETVPAVKQLVSLQTALEASTWVEPGSVESW